MVTSITKAAAPEAPPRDPRRLSPLVLAYIGDTIYDLFARTRLVSVSDMTPHKLHLAAAKYVCAAGQAAAFLRLEPLLSEEELGVYRRGRNAHSGTVPKNASGADYHTATGLEALIGYLYLSGNDARVEELMRIALEGADNGE